MPKKRRDLKKEKKVYEYTLDVGALNPVVNIFKGETFEAKKAEAMEKVPDFLDNLERDLGPGPFFTGARPMYCDFQVYHFLSHIR